MKNILKILMISALLIIPLSQVKAETVANRLKGRILLQVESRGEAYYVHPTSSVAYYMANGDEAYSIMRNLGVGITNNDLEKIRSSKNLAKNHSGKIFLQVESHGEAYYVNSDGTLYYLQNGSEAYNVMRELGLGITNNDLAKIKVSQKVQQKISDSADTLKESQQIKTPDFTTNNNDINKDILSVNNLIFSYSQSKDGNLSFIKDRESEMVKYQNYYDYQNSGRRLINEVANQNYLIDKIVYIENSMVAELKSLLNTGKTSSELIDKLLSQHGDASNEIDASQKVIKDLISTNVKDLSDALAKETEDKQNLIIKMTECDDSIREMTQSILTIKSDYYVKVEALKKSSGSSSSIYRRIDVLTDNANLEIDKINNQISQKQLDCSVYYNE